MDKIIFIALRKEGLLMVAKVCHGIKNEKGTVETELVHVSYLKFS